MSCKSKPVRALRPFGIKNRLPNGVKMVEIMPLFRKHGINTCGGEIRDMLIHVRDNYLSATTHRIVPGKRGKGNGCRMDTGSFSILVACFLEKREMVAARAGDDIGPLQEMYRKY